MNDKREVVYEERAGTDLKRSERVRSMIGKESHTRKTFFIKWFQKIIV